MKLSTPTPKPTLQAWLDSASAPAKDWLATNAGTSVAYLRHIAKGRRDPGGVLALSIEQLTTTAHHATGGQLPVVPREELARACGQCEFARTCRASAAGKVL